MEVKTLSRAALLTAMEKQARITSAICQEFIDAGRGAETMSVIRAKNDDLSVRYIKECALEIDLRFEAERRMTDHGSLTPIKRRA